MLPSLPDDLISRAGSRAGDSHPTFDKEAAKRYRLARRFGEAIARHDDPKMVQAAADAHMRPDDYVIGLLFKGSARAYPLWIIDNYHVVNDSLDGDRFFVTSCERCQSGVAFRSDVPGRPDRAPLFFAAGFQNATLLLKDLRTGSHWIHYEGVGLDRHVVEHRLSWIPTYHMEWSDWVRLHPDSLVMAPPVDPMHPDARHGHGREELFARPGMDPAFLPTLVDPLDSRYSENEMVLGLHLAEGSMAYPLEEVQRAGGVVQGNIGERTFVVFAGPRADGFTMAAFDSRAGGRDLDFTREGGWFIDRESGSRWTIEGTAVQGSLAGHTLEPIPSFYVRWHAWIYFHPETELFGTVQGLVRFTEGRATTDSDLVDEILVALADAGHDVRVGSEVVSQRRPRQAVASRTVYIDGERLRVHAFVSETAARDFDGLSASWSGLPLKSHSYEARTRRIGCVVLESDPEERFMDPAHIIPLPDGAVRWAKVLESPLLADLMPQQSHAAQRDPGFVDIVRALRLAGFEVADVGFLPPAQLRVSAINGVAVTIDADRFLLYRFATAADAELYRASEQHAISVGPFVLRSTPDTMYEHQAYEIRYAGDEWIRWSTLLGDKRLHNVLEETIGRGTIALRDAGVDKAGLSKRKEQAQNAIKDRG